MISIRAFQTSLDYHQIFTFEATKSSEKMAATKSMIAPVARSHRDIIRGDISKAMNFPLDSQMKTWARDQVKENRMREPVTVGGPCTWLTTLQNRYNLGDLSGGLASASSRSVHAILLEAEMPNEGRKVMLSIERVTLFQTFSEKNDEKSAPSSRGRGGT